MPLKHLDEVILEDLRDVMEDEYATLIETYVNDSIARLQSIKGAVESGVADKIRETAHTLKCSSSNIGAVHLSELCKKLEDMGRNDQTEGENKIKTSNNNKNNIQSRNNTDNNRHNESGKGCWMKEAKKKGR